MNGGMPKARMVSMGEMIKLGERFLVPLYQRLYVWKPEQVERLMDDIIAACQRKDPVFYLGGILAIRRGNEGSRPKELELVDGQQRLTTLWLLAVAWHTSLGCESLADFVSVDGEPRFRFAIRESVNRFIRTAHTRKPESSAETAAMEDALSVLRASPDGRGDLGERKPSRGELAEFISKRVKLALTEVPEKTDLTKLFEVINNRGEQLQHHDILKQRVLQLIGDHVEREAYARLWDACASMNGYVERNLLEAQGKTVKEAFENWYQFSEPASLGGTERLIGCLQGESRHDAEAPLTLKDVLKLDDSAEVKAQPRSPNQDDSEEEPTIQSILPFPLLLQHALRIYRHRGRESDLDHVHDKDLLANFRDYFFDSQKLADDGDAKAFIQLLWEVRVALDAYVVKWVERDEGERRLDVRRIHSQNGFARTAEGVPKGLSLLQAVTYHSQGKTSQYWLTPFLNFALDNPSWDEALVYLEYLDHFLFTKPSEKNLRKLSHELLCAKVPKKFFPELPGALDEKSGTDFRHYWFYKTEYVLWRISNLTDRVPPNWRIVARNSVEHIVPRQSIGGKDVAREWLDDFANLALVSREENSQFSNHSFSEKKQAYEARQKGTASLKLELVFQHEAPTDEAVRKVIEEHGEQLKKLWRSYLQRLSDKLN